MRKINYLKFIIILGLVIVLNHAEFSKLNSYSVEYAESVEVDGLKDEWIGINNEEFDSPYGDNYFKAVQTGTKFCMYLYIRDVDYDSTTDRIYMNGGVWIFARNGDIVKQVGGGTVYATSETGHGWAGEFCTPYTNVGISLGSTESLSLELKIYDGGTVVSRWPASGTGTLYSADDWAPPGWCDEDSDCETDQYCDEVYKLLNNECEELECEVHEEAVNHECKAKTGYCNSDEDCNDLEECNLSTHKCEETGTPIVCEFDCCSNSGCASDEYCWNNECLPMPENTCGYVDEESGWLSYECCDNEDCEDPALVCSNHECVEEEDESPDETESGESGISNGELDCEGEVNLQLSYLEGTNKLKAMISGINNCEGKSITLREDNCNGDIKCAFESGDEGGYCEFNAPAQAGTYEYYGCVDLDGDGTKEFDKEIYLAEGIDDGEDGSENGEETQTANGDEQGGTQTEGENGEETGIGSEEEETPWFMQEKNWTIGAIILLGLVVLYFIIDKILPKSRKERPGEKN